MFSQIHPPWCLHVSHHWDHQELIWDIIFWWTSRENCEIFQLLRCDRRVEPHAEIGLLRAVVVIASSVGGGCIPLHIKNLASLGMIAVWPSRSARISSDWAMFREPCGAGSARRDAWGGTVINMVSTWEATSWSYSRWRAVLLFLERMLQFLDNLCGRGVGGKWHEVWGQEIGITSLG